MLAFKMSKKTWKSVESQQHRQPSWISFRLGRLGTILVSRYATAGSEKRPFQAPRETREGEGEGTKTMGVGERKREIRGACNHSLKHLMPPTFSKVCQHVKMSNFSLSGFRLLTRVLEFARLSLHRFDVADTERFSGFEISTLKIL